MRGSKFRGVARTLSDPVPEPRPVTPQEKPVIAVPMVPEVPPGPDNRSVKVSVRGRAPPPDIPESAYELRGSDIAGKRLGEHARLPYFGEVKQAPRRTVAAVRFVCGDLFVDAKFHVSELVSELYEFVETRVLAGGEFVLSTTLPRRTLGRDTVARLAACQIVGPVMVNIEGRDLIIRDDVVAAAQA